MAHRLAVQRLSHFLSCRASLLARRLFLIPYTMKLKCFLFSSFVGMKVLTFVELCFHT